jgi:DNA-binding transcriptional LysR family regulator
LDLRDLAYFEVIAETGHLGRAADRLGRTQPALTKCIQRLEAAIGAELFSRTGRGIALTAVGEVLLGCARQMRSTMDASFREVKAFASGEAGHVRIGTGPTMAEYLLPQVCGGLIEAAPDITVRIFIGMDAVLRSTLRAGGLDILVTPVLVGEEREFTINVFDRDDVVVVAAHGHPLCGRPVTIHDLAPYTNSR